MIFFNKYKELINKESLIQILDSTIPNDFGFKCNGESLKLDKMKKILLSILIYIICFNLTNLYSQTKRSDKLIISSKCAVIYMPDSLKTEKLLKRDGDGFFTASNDVMFYTSLSRDFLEKHKIKVFDTMSRIIEFYKNGKIIKRVDLSGIEKVWGIILFNGSNIVEADMTDIETDFNKYMK